MLEDKKSLTATAPDGYICYIQRMMTLSAEQAGRFWDKVRKLDGDGCWEWQGAKSTAMRYGCMSLGRRGSLRYAHRISWEIANGQIPDGLCVLHRCDNPPCVRPDHLFLGTRSENMADKIEKGRQHRGEQTGGAMLVEAQVAKILVAYATGEFSVLGLAGEYGVTEATVRAIVNGKTWAHVQGPRLSRAEIVAIGKKHRARRVHRSQAGRWVAPGGMLSVPPAWALSAPVSAERSSMTPLRSLGFDPPHAWAILDVAAGRATRIAHGTLDPAQDLADLEAILTEHRPHIVGIEVIERVYPRRDKGGISADYATQLYLAGRAASDCSRLAKMRGYRVEEVTVDVWRQALLGKVRYQGKGETDRAVQQMVMLRVAGWPPPGKPGVRTSSVDERDAAGVALFVAERERMRGMSRDNRPMCAR